MTTIHLGDCQNGCEQCRANCSCDVCCRCAVCQVLIDLTDEGGHIYPNGETLCPSCEADDEEV
jgi:hypothetical protein